MKINNKKAAGPAIIWIIVSIAAFCAIMVLSINSYVNLIDNNCLNESCRIDPAWEAKYRTFENEQSIVQRTTTNASNNMIVSVFQSVGALIGTVFNIGASAIQALGSGAQQSISIINLIQSLIPAEVTVLFWFILLAVTLYIAVQTLRELRGSLVGT